MDNTKLKTVVVKLLDSETGAETYEGIKVDKKIRTSEKIEKDGGI